MHVYIGFKTLFYLVRHLDSTASFLLTGLHLGFFRSWPSLYLPSSFSSVFLVLPCFLLEVSPPYRRHLCRVRKLAWCNDPESYAGGSVATGRATLVGQVKGEHRDKKRDTLLLQVGVVLLATGPRKKN